MNAMGEGCGVSIVTGADDDTCVVALGIPVQADEVEPVQGEHGALLPIGKRQNLIVGDFLIRPSRFAGGEDIISETSQFGDAPLLEVNPSLPGISQILTRGRTFLKNRGSAFRGPAFAGLMADVAGFAEEDGRHGNCDECDEIASECDNLQVPGKSCPARSVAENTALA